MTPFMTIDMDVPHKFAGPRTLNDGAEERKKKKRKTEEERKMRRHGDRRSGKGIK